MIRNKCARTLISMTVAVCVSLSSSVFVLAQSNKTTQKADAAAAAENKKNKKTTKPYTAYLTEGAKANGFTQKNAGKGKTEIKINGLRDATGNPASGKAKVIAECSAGMVAEDVVLTNGFGTVIFACVVIMVVFVVFIVVPIILVQNAPINGYALTPLGGPGNNRGNRIKLMAVTNPNNGDRLDGRYLLFFACFSVYLGVMVVWVTLSQQGTAERKLPCPKVEDDVGIYNR